MIGLEVGRNDDLALEALLRHLNVEHIGGKERSDRGAVHALLVKVEDVVRNLLQNIHVLGVVDVALALPTHIDDQAVGTREGLEVLQKRRHIRLVLWDKFGEAGVKTQLGHGVAKADGDRHKSDRQYPTPLNQLTRCPGDIALKRVARFSYGIAHSAAPVCTSSAVCGLAAAAAVSLSNLKSRL